MNKHLQSNARASGMPLTQAANPTSWASRTAARPSARSWGAAIFLALFSTTAVTGGAGLSCADELQAPSAARGAPGQPAENQAAQAGAGGRSGRTQTRAAQPLDAQTHALLADGRLRGAVQRLAAATVTIRISAMSEGGVEQAVDEAEARRSPASGDLPAAQVAAAGPEIVICTGVAVGERLVVTFAMAPASARFRITLPDGGQAGAAPCVIDRYSGLTLLELDQAVLPALPLADALPAAGTAVLSAAASGIEPPAMSLGMLSAVGRRLPAAAW